LESLEGASKQEKLQHGLCVLWNFSGMRSCDILLGGKLQAVKRVASYLMELELTDYNLTGARIFFL
jgi:hypothetical protein